VPNTFPPRKSLPDSDLACERSPSDLCGEDAIYREVTWESIRLSALTLTAEGGRRIDKPAGRYLSLAFPAPALWSSADKKHLSAAIAAAIRFFLATPPSRVLVAGFGNRRLTADAFGPLVADSVTASAALPEGLGSLSHTFPSRTAVFVPDVFAQTGIDSVKSVSAAAHIVSANAVVALDALAAAEKERLLSVLELTDTGTVPGGGVKRGGRALCEASLGIPVIFLGLPTVIRAGGSHFLIPRDLEAGITAIAAATAEGINAAFGGDTPTLPFSFASLFSKEEP